MKIKKLTKFISSAMLFFISAIFIAAQEPAPKTAAPHRPL